MRIGTDTETSSAQVSERYTRGLLYFDVFLRDGITLTDEDLHSKESTSDFIEEVVKKGIRSLLIVPPCSPLVPPSRRLIFHDIFLNVPL